MNFTEQVESVDRGAGVLFGLERVFDSVSQEQVYNEARRATSPVAALL